MNQQRRHPADPPPPPPTPPPAAKHYLIWALDNSQQLVAGPCVIEAISPGQACEAFLAGSGCFGYDLPLQLVELFDAPESHASVTKYVPDREAAALDQHHCWRLVTPENYFNRVADDPPQGNVL